MPEASEGIFALEKNERHFSYAGNPVQIIPKHYKGRGLNVDVIFRSLKENPVCIDV
jgi:hypothetical protein